MSLDHPSTRSKRSDVDREEARAWVGFYRLVRTDVPLATEVIAQLDADPQMKQRHLALYLSCRQSLRRHKLRQQRDKRIGEFVRRICHGIVVAPIHAFQRGARLAVACLPPSSREPALPQVRRLARDPGFANARSEFEQREATLAPTPSTPPDPTPAGSWQPGIAASAARTSA